ncbi:MAG: hypothetical protein RIS47_1388 [Bacteroidota bacterium]|jgi:outer membrane protein
MKKLISILAIVALVLSVGTAMSQTTQGNYLVGGASALSFSSNKVTPEYDGEKGDDSKSSSFDFSPQVGYFVMDNLAVGLDLAYSSTTDKGDVDVTSTTTVVGVFGRYYLAGEKFRPFAQAELGYAANSIKMDETYKFSGLVYSAEVGAAYFLTESISLDLSLAYSAGSLTNSDDSKYKTKMSIFGFNAGLSFAF